MNEEISQVVARLEDAALSLRAMGRSDTYRGTPQVRDATGAAVSRASGGSNASPDGAPWAKQNVVAEASDLAIVTAVIKARDMRFQFFEHNLFFDPAWSMLIDLYRAELAGRRLSITSVCLGSGVAETTALRYGKLLEERSLIYRTPDPQDGRRAFLRLTSDAMERLKRYFDSVSSRCTAA